MNVRSFVVHLRLHYQFLILSGGYLLGGLLADDPNWQQFGVQFLNVHLLLFGGATAYNSYWDKDEKPVGGLRRPPAMERWMRDASLLMQFAGLAWAATAGWLFMVIYMVSMILFWLYSTPLARWKGNPYLSLVAIGISTGTNSLLMGVAAAGGGRAEVFIPAAFGTALIVLSLYPVSQIYQTAEDRRRGDVTFAMRFGLAGVRRLFILSFISGVLIISRSLAESGNLYGIGFAVAGLGSWIVLYGWIRQLNGAAGEYGQVMRIKFLASFSFVLFILLSLILKHNGIDWFTGLLY